MFQRVAFYRICRNLRCLLFASVFLIFCGTVSAYAYTVTYNCGFYDSGTTPPAQDTAINGTSFTPAANTCLPTNGAVFDGWVVSGTGDVKQSGESFVWNYDEDKTFTAIWKCYWNSDETECVPGYTITLSKNGCSGVWFPPVPDKIYTIQGRGVYIGPERTESQLMEYRRPNDPNHPGKNPIKNPYLRFEYDLDVTLYRPTNPVTGQPYVVEQPSPITQYYTFYFSNPLYFDAGGYITQNAGLANISQDKTIYTGGGGGCGDKMPRESGIAGYTISWYDTNGNEITQKPCSSDCSAPRTGTLYAKWSPISYGIKYNLNGGEWGENVDVVGTAKYDKEFKVEHPVHNEGYIFAGWNIGTLDENTHYYSDSHIFVNGVYQSGTTQTSSGKSINGTKAKYFMNLRSVSSMTDVVFTATWECDTANGYHWDTESETCTNVYNITYHNVDSDWISDQPVSYTYGVGATIGVPNRTGYVFLGWCVNDDNCANYGNNVNYTIPATSNTDIDLYAQWECDTANGYQWNNGECVQTYTLTYSCGDASGGTWDSSESPYPENTTVTLLTNPGARCDASAMHKTFTRWDCDNATPDGNNQFNMPALNVICTAQWDCDNANNWWWNADNTACVAGHTITLQQPESCDYSYNPSEPTMLYVIPNIGIYRDSQRNQLMIQQNQNDGQYPIQMPTATCVVKRNFGNLPRNPVTNELYEPISSVTHNNLGTVSMSDIERTISATSFNFQNQEIMSDFCTNNCTYNAIDSNGYITAYGSALSAVDTDMTWTLSMEPVSVTLTELPQITGYDVLWYNNQNGEGNHITDTFCGWCNDPAEIYAIWTPQTRNVLYYKGAHASSTSVDIYQQTNGITYDKPYTALAFDEAPIAEQMSAAIGWKFVGWTTDSTPTFDDNGNLNNEFTHVDYYQQSDGLFGGLQLYAAYKCDTENGYHLDTNGACVLNTVNLNWIVNGEPYLQNQSSCIYGNGTINGISHEEIPGWTFTGWTVTNWE